MAARNDARQPIFRPATNVKLQPFFEASARAEARHLLGLLRPPANESIEALRSLIDISPKEETDLLRDFSSIEVQALIRKRRQILAEFEVMMRRRIKCR
jgi:hypothetical protein